MSETEDTVHGETAANMEEPVDVQHQGDVEQSQDGDIHDSAEQTVGDAASDETSTKQEDSPVESGDDEEGLYGGEEASSEEVVEEQKTGNEEEESAEQDVEKPAEQEVEQSAEQDTEQAAEQPAEQDTEQAAEQPVEEVEPQAEQQSDKQSEPTETQEGDPSQEKVQYSIYDDPVPEPKLEEPTRTAYQNKQFEENVDYDLLQRQVKTIMDSNMLNLERFKTLSKDNKITAILNLLNSSQDTAFPQENQETATSIPEPPKSEAEKRRLFQRPDLSYPMTPEERERYSNYLRNENRIAEMQNLPPKSRLFIGNLPLKNVSKEDLYRLFSPFGQILQINIKNAFGFIQYNNPLSVTDAIECESQETNFGKKLILEVSSSNSRPQYDHGDHGTNSSSTFISTSKRPFQEENDTSEMYVDSSYGGKKSKRRIPNCIIYVKRTADRSYATEVFNQFKNGTGLETDMIFLKPRMELRTFVNEAAHDGVWGVVLINKTRNVDVQTFYKGPHGETKFDEYISISSEDAVAIFNNMRKNKQTRGFDNMNSFPPAQYQQYPNQGYNSQYQQPPYGQSYNMAPQNQGYNNQQYDQNYRMMNQQGYNSNQPVPMQQNYGQYQNPSMLPQNNSMGYNQTSSQMNISQQPQVSALLGGNPSKMDQGQLLNAIQNLPPNVVSNLLAITQQNQQQARPQQDQQQLLNLLQMVQNPNVQPSNQQPNFGGAASTQPYQKGPMPLPQQQQPHISPMNPIATMNQEPYMQASNPPPPPSTQQQQQLPQQEKKDEPVTNNVQSLLNSLAKLQK